MSRKTSFKELMFRSLNSKNRFGQSKFLAKQESYRKGNGGRVQGIYSKKTMQDYKKVAEQFHQWQKDKGYHFRSLDEVTVSVVVEYLKDRQSKGYSAWTISRDQSALNKIFNMNVSKKEHGLLSRHISNIRNNRGLSNNYRYSVYTRNQDMIKFISACGIRRQSLTTLKPSQAIRNSENIVIGFTVTEKGGKTRNCYVRKEFQSEITAFVDEHSVKNGNKPFWKRVDKNLNTHWYRGEYAQGLYRDLLSAKQSGADYFQGYRSIFISEDKLGAAVSRYKATVKGYDTEVLALVSQNLGHNRIDVIYTNYLNR